MKKLREQLDRAIEDFGVRTLATQDVLCVLMKSIR
jgi:hypothetical protein